MRTLILAGTLVVLPLLLAGCTADTPPEGVIPQGYEDAMERAGSVENTLHEAANLRMETAADNDP